MADREITVGSITTQNLTPGGDATPGSAVEIDTANCSNLTAQVVGTYTGVLSVQVTLDGKNWLTLAGATSVTRLTTGVQTATITSAEQDAYNIAFYGVSRYRITALAAVTGSARVTLRSKLPA